ncbi:hypothetical protein RUM43_012663 [Polyplax serrata]|uniref:Uncharacterized protein n=1 Tax=Polyplax serrata TaxID=468196 RepID=A0AAN8Q310_POLSC
MNTVKVRTKGYLGIVNNDVIQPSLDHGICHASTYAAQSIAVPVTSIFLRNFFGFVFCLLLVSTEALRKWAVLQIRDWTKPKVQRVYFPGADRNYHRGSSQWVTGLDLETTTGPTPIGSDQAKMKKPLQVIRKDNWNQPDEREKGPR